MAKEMEDKLLKSYAKDLASLYAKEKKEKQELKTIFRNINDGLLIVDKNLKILRSNRRFRFFFGLKKEDLLNKNIFDILKNKELKAILKSKVNQKIFLSEIVFDNYPDKLFKVNLVPLLEGYLLIFQNNTLINKFSQKLKKQENWLKSIIDNIQSGLAIIDFETRKILQINPELEKILKISKEQIIGKDCFLFLCAGDKNLCPNSEGVKTTSYILSTTDYQQNPVYLYKKVSIIDTYDKKYIIESIVDITELKKAEDKLRQSNQRIKTLFNNLPFILIGVNKENKIIEWNPMAEIFSGLKREQVLNKDFYEIKDKLEVKDILDFKLDFGTIQKEVRYKRSDGKFGFLEIKAIDFRDNDNILIIIAQDTTNFKIMQSQLNQAQKLEAIGQLASGIAHEINTPAQYVTDNLYFLNENFPDLNNFLKETLNTLKNIPNLKLKALLEKAEELDLEFFLEEFPKAIEQALEGIQNIAKIVQSMKQFAHPGTKEKVYTDLNKTIENARLVSKNSWKYVADFELDLDKNLPNVKCYPAEINQVLLNMIVNAADAIKAKFGKNTKDKKGKITISTKSLKDRVKISISDTGCGIPENIREKIFEPFFTTKEVGKGTGQGLSIAYSIIVEKHKGSIQVESEEGKGTTFILELPVDG